MGFVLAGLLAVCVSGCERLERLLLERAADRALAGDRQDWLGDGALHLVLCGTGSPLADPQRAGPCAAVIAGGRLFLIDVGPGSWENVQLWRLPRADLAGVLLTHFHSDHIAELGETALQSWVAGRREALPVYGPPGVVRVVDGFRLAYSLDAGYRTAHHGEQAMPPSGAQLLARTIDLDGSEQSSTVLEDGALRVTAFAVEHEPASPAYGYRFDYNGRGLVISGDTKRSPSVVRHARGADLLLHEALAAHLVERVSEIARKRGDKRWAKLAADILDYHATPADAVESARAAGVHMLVLTHLVPPLPNRLVRRLFLEGVDRSWDGRLVVGEDGMHFSLPAGSARIDIERLG